MVTFVCCNCNSSLKKAHVQFHGCNGKFACITCNSDFTKSNYKSHDRCITEAEKYQGSDFKAKVNKGEIRQEIWSKTVSDALCNISTNNQALKEVINQVKNKSNFPIKEAKFRNFLNAVPGVRRVNNCHEIIWGAISNHKEALKLSSDNINQTKTSDTKSNSQEKKRKHDDNTAELDAKKTIISEENTDANSKKMKLEDRSDLNECDVKVEETKKTKKTKKVKSVKDAENVDVVEETQAVEEFKKEKKSKKNKKSDVKNESVEVVEEVALVDGDKKKKKKKSKKAKVDTEETNGDVVESMDVDETVNVLKSVDVKSEMKEEKVDEVVVVSKKDKKKKSKKERVVTEEPHVVESMDVDESVTQSEVKEEKIKETVVISKKDKKKKKSRKSHE